MELLKKIRTKKVPIKKIIIYIIVAYVVLNTFGIPFIPKINPKYETLIIIVDEKTSQPIPGLVYYYELSNYWVYTFGGIIKIGPISNYDYRLQKKGYSDKNGQILIKYPMIMLFRLYEGFSREYVYLNIDIINDKQTPSRFFSKKYMNAYLSNDFTKFYNPNQLYRICKIQIGNGYGNSEFGVEKNNYLIDVGGLDKRINKFYVYLKRMD